MPVCLRSQPSCHASLKFAGYSNLLNRDGVCENIWRVTNYIESKNLGKK